MKKIFRNVVVFSVAVLVAGVFSACHRGSASAGAVDESEGTKVISGDQLNPQNEVNKTLVLKFKKKPQSVTFNGVTYGSSAIQGPDANGDYYIEVSDAKNGKVTVNYGSDYFTETVYVTFGDNEVVELNIPLVKKSSDNKQSLADLGGAAGSVTNDSNNQSEEQMNGELGGVNAQIDIPAGVGLQKEDGSTYTGSDDFTITVFTPAESPKSESSLTQDASFDCAVLGVRCTPDGAYFTTPVQVKVQIPEVAGYNLKLFNDDDKKTVAINALGGDWYQSAIPHFSSWIYSLKAKITSITSEQVPVAGGQYEVAKGGRTSVPYVKNYGYELIDADNVPAVAKQFATILFSASKREISSSFSFYAPSEGVLDWTVKQTVRTYTFDATAPNSSDKKTFQVKFYGAVTPEVSFRVPEEPEQPATEPDVPTHNGGGSNSL